MIIEHPIPYDVRLEYLNYYFKKYALSKYIFNLYHNYMYSPSENFEMTLDSDYDYVRHRNDNIYFYYKDENYEICLGILWRNLDEYYTRCTCLKPDIKPLFNDTWFHAFSNSKLPIDSINTCLTNFYNYLLDKGINVPGYHKNYKLHQFVKYYMLSEYLNAK